MAKKYKNIEDTFKYAYVGIPKGVCGLKKAFFGNWFEFQEKYPNFKFQKKIPLVLFMHGSSGLFKGDVYRKFITQKAKCIFFAPDSFRIKNRPTYKSPSTLKKYNKVHKLRQAEIRFNLKKLDFIDKRNIFLMGHSEGGLACSIFKSKKFKGRIITSFPCENSYFYQNFKLGSQKNEPFLNIIGTDDQFFAKNSKFNKNYADVGDGSISLKKNRNAKVVILPKTKHDITKNIYVKDEIINFLTYWIKN